MWPTTATPSERRAQARWTSAAKDGVGTARSYRSPVWFTLVRGVLTEVYYPRIAQANIRQLRLAAVGHRGLWVEGDETDDDAPDAPRIQPLASWAPGYEVSSGCSAAAHGLRIEKTIITDINRPVVLQRIRIHHDGERPTLYALLEPHLANRGEDNDGWLGDYKGAHALFARRGQTALALVAARPFADGACSYAGVDDALSDLRRHRRLTVRRRSATSGVIQLAAKIDLGDDDEFVLALGFGSSPDQAAQQARASLLENFDNLLRRFVAGWREHHESYRAFDCEGDEAIATLHDVSVAVLGVHQDKEDSGATIASLAIPWGGAHGDSDRGGYHLVWPRDLVETAGALAAVGLTDSARGALLYLMSTQDANGEWPQNMWLDGTALWRSLQLDEVSLPILLASAMARDDALDGLDPWPMVHRAASYLLRHGPCSPEDRWEEEAGYSPYTIAAMVAALTAAATMAQQRGHAPFAAYLLDTADFWNDSIERWTYVTGTPTAQRHGVDGYYVRLTPPAAVRNTRYPDGTTPMALLNQSCEPQTIPYGEIVSPDALALVRFGLRTAEDPRMRNTVKVIDAELMTETARGPVWHRFTHDGYGETPNGGAFHRWGCGRGWPLLVGERAHFEIAAGRVDRARELRRVMAAQAGVTGLLPEQIWDAPDILKHGLRNGRPSGSAMPLVWTHSEFLKLCRSITDGRVYDAPPEALARYGHGPVRAAIAIWRRGEPTTTIRPGQMLRVQTTTRRVRHGNVEWSVAYSDLHGSVPLQELPPLGLSYADLPTSALPAGASIRFRIRPARGEGAGGADTAMQQGDVR